MAVPATVPLIVKVAVAPVLRVTVVFILPVPFGVGQLPLPAGTLQVQVALRISGGRVSVTAIFGRSIGALFVTVTV